MSDEEDIQHSKPVSHFAIRAVFAVLMVGVLAILLFTYRQVGPSIRCLLPGSDDFSSGLQARTVSVDGEKRCYWLYLPETRPSQDPLTIVFSFHGFSSSPYGQMTFSQWNRVANQEGFGVVYPQGSGFPMRWNALPALPATGLDDVAFFNAMLLDLDSALDIDHRQIFVTGFSNGGAMALRLICESGNRIKAAGTVAAPVPNQIAGCQPEHPVPLMSFHGTSDPVVPFLGRQRDLDGQPGMLRSSFDLLAFETWIEIWAEGYQCTSRRVVSVQGDSRIFNYQGCMDGADLSLIIVEGGGHTWPGGENVPFVGKTTRDIDASTALWSFFQTNLKPR